MKFQVCFLLLILCLFSTESNSQPRIQWANTYCEEPRGAKFYDVYLTLEGDFALCGQTARGANAHFGWITLIDSETLDVLFNLELGEDGDYIQFNSIVEVDGGGFLAAGTDCRRNGHDFQATRVTNEGDLLWTEYYGDGDLQACNAVIELKSGNFLLAGWERERGAGEWGYLVQINGEGELIWEEIYRGEGQRKFTSIRETDDGYLLAGINDGDGWLLKVNDIGEVIWSQTYERDMDEQPFYENFHCIISCPGGYLLSGGSSLMNFENIEQSQGNFWMVKVNNQGNQIWEQVYELGDPGYPKYFQSAILMRDGGFALVGLNTCIDDWGARFRGGVVLRTNNLGEINWIHNLPVGQQEISVSNAYAVVTTPDGGIIVAGSGELIGRQPGGIIMKVIPERSGPVIIERIPEETQLNVLVGDSIFFSVYAVDLQDDSLSYYWILENDTLTNDTCVTVTFEEQGDFIVECFVSDGELADSTFWIVNASEFYIDGQTPDSLEINVRRGDLVNFSFDIAAIEEIELNYTWTHIDRDQRQNLIGEVESVEYVFNQSGDQRIVGEVDSDENSEERIWQVHVRSSIYSWWPSELELSAYVDSTLEFIITPFNEDSDSIEYLWLLDEEQLESDSASVLITFSETELSEVTAIVNDGIEADTIRWTVNVEEWSFTADDADFADMPTSPVLYPASPNPFNSTVKLLMYLPRVDHVSLSVFDVSGREVSRLVDGNVRAGNQSVVWDAREYPAGVYVLRMDVGNVSEVRKMVLVR